MSEPQDSAGQTSTGVAGNKPCMSVQELEKLLSQSRGLSNRFIADWYLNVAFYVGEQWLFWNRNRLDRPRIPKGKLQLTDNRIIGIVRTEISKMTKQKPAWQIIPTTAKDEDIQASQTGEKILEYLWRHLAMRTKLMGVLEWSRICTGGFWKIYWDSSKGEKYTIVLDPEGKPAVSETTGGPLLPMECPDGLPEGHTEKTMAMGDVAIEVVTPFEFFPDPIAKTMEDCEWCIQVAVKSKDYVKQHFGVAIEPDTEVTGGIAESLILPTFQGGAGGTTGYKGVKISEYWSKASAKYPKGLRVVWAKGKVLLEEPNPYNHLPYVMFKGITVPGRFWPTSTVTQLRSPQMELNKAKSQVAENAQKVGNPALLTSKQANVQYSGRPGEHVAFDDTTQNAIPSYLQPPQLPQYVLQQQDRQETSLQDISGQHEVSSAQVPTGVTAASAINLLQEADDTRLGPAIYDMEETLGIAGMRLLELVARFWTVEKTILIGGEDQAWDAMVFKGAALRENTHVEVQSGSMFPQSKAAKQAGIERMLNMALQYSEEKPNPRVMRKVMRDYQAGGLEALFGDLTVDEQQINRENGQMAQGAVIPINSFDDQEAHIEGHTEFQKGPSYSMLPPPVKGIIEKHVAEHREQLMRSMGPMGAQAPQEKHDPVETLAYKDAPPDVKRQIEQQAGLEPSKEEPEDEGEGAQNGAAPAAQPTH